MKPIRGMTHNIEGTDSPAKRQASFRKAVSYCIGGIGVLNEINPADLAHHRAHLKAHNLRWFRRGQNAIVWDPRVIKKNRLRSRVIMVGGHVGADGVAGQGEDRRVGPSRNALKFLGTVIESGDSIMVVCVHKVAKAFTTERWRERLWRASTRRTARFVMRSIKNYPHGFIAGDENAPFIVNYPGVPDHRVETPPTHGQHSRYDQVHPFGKLVVNEVTEFLTASDHGGLTWQMHVGRTV